jgi:hypothetical protein
VAVIEWKQDADTNGWTGGVGCAWALDIWPHEKHGWEWSVICDDAEQNAPEGWDPTLEDAMVHSERAYFDWRDVMEGRKPADEHDETAEIVADAVAQERAAVVAFLREQAGPWVRDDAGWGALSHASLMIERGEHRRGEGA